MNTIFVSKLSKKLFESCNWESFTCATMCVDTSNVGPIPGGSRGVCTGKTLLSSAKFSREDMRVSFSMCRDQMKETLAYLQRSS